MEWVWTRTRRFWRRQVKVDHNGLLTAADDHSFYRLIGLGIHLLMRNVGRNVNEIAGASFIHKFEIIAPAETRASTNDIENGLQFPVMMNARSCRRLHRYGSSP